MDSRSDSGRQPGRREPGAGAGIRPFALEAEVQDSDLSDGLPVNRSVAERWVDKNWENGEAAGVGGDSDYHITGHSPTRRTGSE